MWTLAFFRSFRQSPDGYFFFSFLDNIIFPGWGCEPHAQPPAILEDQCFLSGLSPLAGWSQFGRVRISLFALAWLSRKNVAQESRRGRACTGLGRRKRYYPRLGSTHPLAGCAPSGPHTTPLTPPGGGRSRGTHEWRHLRENVKCFMVFCSFPHNRGVGGRISIVSLCHAWPGGPLSWFSLIVVFLSSRGKFPYYLKLGHYRLLAYSSSFIIQLSFPNSSRYILSN
jgi:hypothetical protein